jgi:hypothetical protein
MGSYIRNLLKEAATNADIRKELLEHPSRVVAKRGYMLSADERRFLDELPRLVAEGVIATFGDPDSQPMAQGIISQSAARFVASQAQQAAQQARAAGLSPAAQRFASQYVASQWAKAAAAQASARKNVQASTKLQFVTSRDRSAD